MAIQIIIYCFLGAFLLKNVETQENIGVLNGKKAINVVSDQFLSISIDPAVLLSGISMSPISLKLARHLQPAYLRLAGPSTVFLQYSSNETLATDRITEATTVLTVTPSMWSSLVTWLTHSRLTPIFALNNNESDEETADNDGYWNTQSIRPLLELTSRLNVSCYWQIGYDCSNKTFKQYKEDIKALRNILDIFPDEKEIWKIVGSDLNSCIQDQRRSDIESMVEDFEVDAIMWEKSSIDSNNFEPGRTWNNLFVSDKPEKVPIWTSAPKTTSPVSFDSGILWAKQIGDAAKNGFQVLFRQPRLHEIFADTPTFWISYLHKKLMGQNVLDIKLNSNKNIDSFVYAHCSKKQNRFTKSGALTIFIINNSTDEQTTALKLSTFQPNNKLTYEVQTFILNASTEEPSYTLLNGDKLDIDSLQIDKFSLTPKLRRARIHKHLTLTLPPKSVGFFVLPGARIPICMSDEESESDSILKEINEDQKLSFSGEMLTSKISARMPEKSRNLNDLYQLMEKELESDEQFYKKQLVIVKPTKGWKIKNKSSKIVEEERQQGNGKSFVELPKLLEVRSPDEKLQELKAKIKEKLDLKKLEVKKKPKVNLELTNEELVKVLTERARSQIDKSKGLSDKDIEDLVQKALKMRTRQKRAAKNGHFNGHVSGHNHGHGIRANRRRPNIARNWKLTNLRRQKRDINMDLLRLKTGANDEKSKIKGKTSKFSNNDEKEATFRKLDETSDELLKDESEEIHEEQIPSEVFAELAKLVESTEEDSLPDMMKILPITKKLEPSSSKKTVFSLLETPATVLNINKPKLEFPMLNIAKLKPLTTTTAKSKSAGGRNRKVEFQDKNTFVDELDGLDSLENDDLSNYHGFFEQFADSLQINKPKQHHQNRELFELDTTIGVTEDEANLKSKLDELLENEFIGNKKDRAAVQDTIKKLEQLFQKNSNLNPIEELENISDDDYEFDDQTFTRFKRDVDGEYTEEDIHFYKQLMQSNIKHMREQMIKSRLKTGDVGIVGGSLKKKLFKDNNNESEGSESRTEVLGNMQTEHQKKVLKNRLHNHRKKLQRMGSNAASRFKPKKLNLELKKLDFNPKKIQFNPKKIEEIINKKRLNNFKTFSDGFNNLRRKRSHQYDQLYIPQPNIDHYIKSYESILGKVLAKSDKIVKNAPKKFGIEIIDDPEVIGIEIPRVVVKAKRHIRKEDELNMIDDIGHFFNTIEKETMKLKPYLDEESSEYSLVFPTNDEIRLVKNRGQTELEFVHNSETTTVTEKPVDLYTCPVTYDFTTEKVNIADNEIVESVTSESYTDEDYIDSFSTTTEFINVNIVEEGDDDDENRESLRSDDDTTEDRDDFDSSIEKNTNSNVEKVPKNGSHAFDILEKVIGGVKSFVDTVGKKVNTYFHIFHRSNVNSTLTSAEI